MTEFIDRQQELDELDALLKESQRIAQFAVVYGRRRVGKTRLLLQFAQQSDVPYLYWMARRETPEASRHGLSRVIWRETRTNVDGENKDTAPPHFSDWDSLFEWLARSIGNRPTLLIFDEFSYAVESDPSLPSNLQYAWDHLFKEKPIMLILAGSHISMMTELFQHHAPLYGRFTAQLQVEPLPFHALAEFFPNYTAAERVATYAVLGSVPAYLERFDPEENLSKNIRHHIFRRVGMFRSEPTLLLSDLVREPRTYAGVLQAVANNCHTITDISRYTGIATSGLGIYVSRLLEMKLIERRVSATVPPGERQTSKRGRYHLLDSYLRFYYRFIEPNLELIELGRLDVLWSRIGEQFRAFIGMTAFEELCRQWVLAQASAGNLCFSPEIVGSHWDKDMQIDVAALNWRDKAILLGECKWGTKPVGKAVLRDLLDKTSHVVPVDGWQVHYVLFGRDGFTDSARSLAAELDMRLIDLPELDAGLGL